MQTDRVGALVLKPRCPESRIRMFDEVLSDKKPL
jgi:hypothetical protein